MRFFLSILVITILLSGYEAASHVVNASAADKANIETASVLPCPDHHSNDTPAGKAPGFEANCHHCGAFPIGGFVAVAKDVYARRGAYIPVRQAFVPNGLSFLLLRPPQTRA